MITRLSSSITSWKKESVILNNLIPAHTNQANKLSVKYLYAAPNGAFPKHHYLRQNQIGNIIKSFDAPTNFVPVPPKKKNKSNIKMVSRRDNESGRRSNRNVRRHHHLHFWLESPPAQNPQFPPRFVPFTATASPVGCALPSQVDEFVHVSLVGDLFQFILCNRQHIFFYCLIIIFH